MTKAIKSRASLYKKKNEYKPSHGALYYDILNNHYDSFSEQIGIPGSILKKQSKFEENLLNNSKDKDTFKSKLRTNRAATPIGDYMRKWVNNNYALAVQFLSKNKKTK
tara:strand:+ start:455 stop:778 length:324 start_codon:yes stop_codon:yes gene_type:complete